MEPTRLLAGIRSALLVRWLQPQARPADSWLTPPPPSFQASLELWFGPYRQSPIAQRVWAISYALVPSAAPATFLRLEARCCARYNLSQRSVASILCSNEKQSIHTYLHVSIHGSRLIVVSRPDCVLQAWRYLWCGNCRVQYAHLCKGASNASMGLAWVD